MAHRRERRVLFALVHLEGAVPAGLLVVDLLVLDLRLRGELVGQAALVLAVEVLVRVRLALVVAVAAVGLARGVRSGGEALVACFAVGGLTWSLGGVEVSAAGFLGKGREVGWIGGFVVGFLKGRGGSAY